MEEVIRKLELSLRVRPLKSLEADIASTKGLRLEPEGYIYDTERRLRS